MKRPRRQSGFTLIELLIVVAIIGIIAAIAIPNLLNAIDRSKQKATMASMKALGTAVETYAIDVNFYPIATSLMSVDGDSMNISPVYIKSAPSKDGWAGALYYGSNSSGSDYTLVSYGKDKQPSSASVGGTKDFDCDIIYQNGTFVAYPEGIQT